jgi:hypothetical protein
MPRIAEFYGISIYMYYRDHTPPHFHAIYAQYEVQVEIRSGEPLAGRLPPRAQALVREWAARYRDELMNNWHRARAHRPLVSILPLD